MRLFTLALGLALLGTSGCAYSIRVTSRPGSITLVEADGTVHTTPALLRVKPFKKQVLAAEASGYRSSTVRLRHRSWAGVLWAMRKGGKHASDRDGVRGAALEVELMPDHGPSGTWVHGQ